LNRQSPSTETGSPYHCGLKTPVMAVLQTLVDEVVANIVVEQGVDKIGGILLDEIHTLLVQGHLVCCMTPWDFFETFTACQRIAV
jgi:hypothetical protein